MIAPPLHTDLCVLGGLIPTLPAKCGVCVGGEGGGGLKIFTTEKGGGGGFEIYCL